MVTVYRGCRVKTNSTECDVFMITAAAGFGDGGASRGKDQTQMQGKPNRDEKHWGELGRYTTRL